MTRPALELHRVTFGYTAEPLFRGFDLAVGRGEMTGVLGPNGTGKTTLVRLASGTLVPGGGTVRLDGDDAAGLAPRERARRIAVVPQETRLAFDYSVHEVVAMGRAPHQGLLGLENHRDREQVQLAMQRTGIEALAARRFRQLSGGERQRVVIARALGQEPDLLLLDEPTAFLDLRHRLIVYELLTRLNREAGLTVVVVSHDINLVARYCSRLVLLEGGRAVADGPPERVLVPDNIRAVYGVDSEVRPDPVSGRPHVVALRPQGAK